MTPIQTYVDQNRERTLAELKELLEIPSVSTNPDHAEDVRTCAERVAERMREAGLETSIHDTARHPVAYGERLNAPGKPTLLIYGHYDVQPPDPLELWRHGPFTPVVEGDHLVARGATDDKGQWYALLKGVQASLEVNGELPINVKMLVEGEEEIGSPNLTPFIQKEKERLACDVVVVSDCQQFAPDVPAITYGLKGMCYLEITVTGPGHDLHSGAFGGSLANPANVLTQLMAACIDADGRITIPGFYDDVRELEPKEREQFASLPFDEAKYIESTGAAKPFGEPGHTTLERKWVRPTFDINGLNSGFTGEGAKTVLPSVASAKFSMRLVPDQDPVRIEEQVMSYLEEIAPETVHIEIVAHHGAKAVVVPRDSREVQAAVAALQIAFGREPVFIREGGSIPVVGTFKDELGVDTLLIGLGQSDDGAHSPNERFRIEDYYRGQVMLAALLEELAKD